MESALVKSQPEWNKKDKLNLLNIQKILSGLGFFFSIVECTNIFLTNQRESNQFILAFGIITIFVTILNLITLAWALKQTGICNQDQDNAAESTDNLFSRIVLVLNLLIYTIFTISYFLYNFAQTDMDNEYTANHNSKEISSLGSYLSAKQGWIDFLSISNIIVGLFSVFTAYSLASSAMTHRLMVYILICFSVWISWAQLGQITALKQVYEHSSHKYTEWALNVIYGVAIANVVFLVLTWFANTRKLRIAYLILGAFFLCAVALQIPSTGRLFRDYRELTLNYKDKCVEELGQLSVTYVENSGCPNKYIYATRSQCPLNPQQCFLDPNQCPAKQNLQQVWETDLVSDPINTNVLGCINTSCCGVLINTYTRPVLKQAIYSLDFLFCTFFLAVFTFQLSSMDKGDKQLPKNVLTILTVVFFLIVIGGIFYVNWPADNYLNRRGIVTDDLQVASPTVIHIQKNQQLQHYLKDGCQNLNEFISHQTAATSTFRNAVGYSTVTNLGDLEHLVGADPSNNLCGNQLCDGYIVILRSTQLLNDPPFSQCLVQFDFNQDKDNEHLRVLDTVATAGLIPRDISASPPINYNYFGIIGTQEKIEAVLQGELKICGWNTFCNQIAATAYNNNKFVARVIKVQLNKFGFGKPLVEAKPVVPTVSPTVSFISQHKKLNHIHKEHQVDENMLNDRMRMLRQTHGQEIKEHHLNLPIISSPSEATLMTVIVHDLEDDQPLEDAEVKIYVGTANFNANCKDPFAAQHIQPDFIATTGKDGKAILETFVFSDTNTANYYKYSIYAKKNGFTVSCRTITFSSKAAITAHGDIDLGLGKILSKGQTRVVLTWDLWAGRENTQDISKPFDLDLWATFGQYQASGTIPQFDCHVGLTDRECGGVKYHGDSLTKKHGKSSEAITFKTLGTFNYLVYFNRFYPNLPVHPATTHWVTDIASYTPLLSYYSSESDFPQATFKTNDLILGGHLLPEMDANTKFDILAFCIKASGSAQTEEATILPLAQYQNIWTNSPSGTVYNDVTKNALPSTKSAYGTAANAPTVCQ